MSTSLTRDTHFRGSRVPKTPPKSTNNAAKVPQKTRRFLHRFLNGFFIDFGSILGPMGGPSWSQNRLKWGEGRGPWNRLGAQGAQARHQTLKISQEASPAIRFNVPWPSLGLQISIFYRSPGQNCSRTPTRNVTWTPHATGTKWNQQALVLQRSWVNLPKTFINQCINATSVPRRLGEAPCNYRIPRWRGFARGSRGPIQTARGHGRRGIRSRCPVPPKLPRSR